MGNCCGLGRQHNLVVSVSEHDGVPQISFSDGWSSLIGITPARLQDIKGFIHSEDQDIFDIHWDKAIKSHHPQQFEFRVKQHENYRWLLSDLVPVSGSPGLFATFIDITGRKLAELDSGVDHNFINLVLDSLHAFIAYVDADGRYQYVNRAHSEFFGQDYRNICGKTVDDITYLSKTRLHQALQGKKIKYEDKIHANNEMIRCSITLVPHFCDGGLVEGVFVLMEQIGNQQIIDSHLEDLERFMSHWQPNPKEMCHFVGRAVARVGHRNIPDLFFGISTAYFAFHELCQRIDYIYEHWQNPVGGQCGDLLKELVEFKEQSNVVCLKDIGGNHSGVRVMLVRDTVDGYLTYSLRYFVNPSERLTGYLKACWQRSAGRPTFDKVLNALPSGSPQLYEDEYSFWNFRNPVDVLEGVIVYPDARGFHDLPASKSVADFIVLSSNLLGYGKSVRTLAR